MKLQINYRKKNVKSTNMWLLNKILLKKKKESMKNSEEIRKYFNIYDNGNTAFQNQWDAAKEHQRGKFIAI